MSLHQLARLAVLLALATGLQVRPAAAKCELAQVAALPVRVTHSRILLDGEINAQPVEIILDTGAETSLIFADAARRLGLLLDDSTRTTQMFGAGGGVAARRVFVRDLNLGQEHLHGLSFWAAGDMADEPHVAMLLGQDVLETWDVEYDLKHGAVRLLHPAGCRGDDVVYWAAGYHKARMRHTLHGGAAIDLDVGLNRSTAAAKLDTGAPRTILALPAALRAGVASRAAPVDGAQVSGLGAHRTALRRVRLDSLSLGGEVVRHAEVDVADLFASDTYDTTGRLTGERVNMPDMLLGLDFVRAHRLLVAPDQDMVYFTYEGGPVFGPEPGEAR